MRRLILILLPLCIMYFLVGAILMWTNVLDQTTYLTYAGVVGGIASVLGLLSFVRPALTQTDIQNIEAESLQKLGEVSVEIKRLEEARSKTATQITDLETQKREMELLVRKASMSLFLKEQYDHNKKVILEHISKEPKLVESISELSAVEKKMTALEEEIEKDDNVELLRRIIHESRTTPSTLDAAIENAPPITRTLLRILKAYSQMFQLAFKISR